MPDLHHLFFSAAHAADAAPVPPEAGVSSTLMKFLPLFLIFGVFYFLLIRPQQKRLEEQTAMIKALKKGDRVITSGGIVGTVVNIEGEDFAVIEIAQDVRIRVVLSTVNNLLKDKDSHATDAKK